MDPARSAPPESPAVRPAAPAAAASHLDVVPVDPHRIFAHWQLAPAEFARLQDMAGPHPGDAHLTLRVFRLPEPESTLLDATQVHDFPAGALRHEGFFSVREPGGYVVAALGTKNPQNRFTPALTSVHVALPEAPRPGVPAAPEPTAAPPAPEASPQQGTPPRPAPGPARVLDEAAVLAAAENLHALPPELRKLPGKQAAAKLFPAPPPPHPPPPETPALDEHTVISAALRAMIAPDAADAPAATASGRQSRRAAVAPAASPSDESPTDPASPAPPEAAVAPAPLAGRRLASMVSLGGGDAPIRVSATLLVSGRLAPGQRLRLGDREVVPQRGGQFTWQHRLDTFAVAWPLLLYVLAQPDLPRTPSLELLGQLPDDRAPFTLHATVEIEGEIQDPAYRAHLPEGLAVDAAGRFRLVRPLPAGVLLLPHLVLLAAGPPG